MMPMTSQKIEERAADWIAARDSARWTPGLQRELEVWLDESPLHRVAYLRLDSVWRCADRLQAMRTSNPASSRWQLFGRIFKWLAPRTVQAAFAVAALTAVIVWLPGLPGERQATEIGERKTVSLADGSRLTLNTATRLRTEVGDTGRRVWLDDGEAYFDIAHDPQHPFVVRVGRQRVSVIGTRFTVRRQGDRVKVAVLEGRVQVAGEDAPPVLLDADQTATLADASAVVSRQTSRQSMAEIGWLDGKLVFDRTTLGEAAASFNRYNRKQLRIDDSQTASLEIGGTFGATNVDGFARLLRSSFGLEVREKGEQIVVTGSGGLHRK